METITLNTEVNKYTAFGVLHALNNSEDEELKISISSLGGDFDEGLKMYYALVESDKKSTVTFSGRSASAATIFAMGATKRRIYQNSFILVHKVLNTINLQKAFNSDSIDDFMKGLKSLKGDLDKFDLAVAGIYYNKAKAKGKSEKDILKLMTKNTWLTAEVALDWGLVDEVIREDAEVENQEQLMNYYKLPAIKTIEKQAVVTAKTKDKMNFLEKTTDFFKSVLNLSSEDAKMKANEFTASLNNDITAHLTNVAKDFQPEASAQITALENSISKLENATPEKIDVSQFASKSDFNSIMNELKKLTNVQEKQATLENKIEKLGEKKITEAQPILKQGESWLSHLQNKTGSNFILD